MQCGTTDSPDAIILGRGPTKVRKTAVVLVGVLATLAGCSHGGLPPISTGERYAADGPCNESYPLAPGDKVRLAVYNEGQFNGDYAVSSDGKLSLPLIGDVPVAGHTVEDVVRDVRARLADGYLLNPRVSMEVQTYRPFFVMGEVKMPGQYPYSNCLTLFNAIATAQGATPRASLKSGSRVVIQRAGETFAREYVVKPNLRIYPGDTVRVKERLF